MNRISSTLLALVVASSCRQVLELEDSRVVGGSAGDAGLSTAGGTSGEDASGSGASAGAAGAPSGSAGEEPGAGGEHSQSGSSGMPPDEGSSGAAGAGGGGGEDDGPPLCERYCAAITQNCTGDYAQYPDVSTCLAVCSVLPRGKNNESDVNTVHCRLAEAEKAGSGEPFFYCPMAGPGGGGKCGVDCEGYCQIMMALCTEDSTYGQYFYADKAECLQACAEAPVAEEPYSSSKHATGDHLQCWLFHACASVADPDYHCGHALGEAPCAPL